MRSLAWRGFQISDTRPLSRPRAGIAEYVNFIEREKKVYYRTYAGGWISSFISSVSQQSGIYHTFLYRVELKPSQIPNLQFEQIQTCLKMHELVQHKATLLVKYITSILQLRSKIMTTDICLLQVFKNNHCVSKMFRVFIENFYSYS